MDVTGGRTGRIARRPAGGWVALVLAVAAVVAAGCAGPTETAVAETGPAPATTGSDPVQYAAEALDVMELSGYFVDPATWPAVRTEAERAVHGARDTASTYPALSRALAVAGGPHSRLIPAGRSLADIDPEPARPPSVDGAPDGISVVTVPDLVAEDPGALQGYADATEGGITRAAGSTTCGWIVDLRGNSGGNVWPMLAGLSPLLGDGPMLSFASREGSTPVLLRGGAAVTGDTVQARVAPTPRDRHPVAVLQDGDTASSAEAVLLAFRGMPGVRTFGTDSAGYTNANATVPMPDGASLLLTTAVYVDRAGKPWNGRIAAEQAAPDAAAAARTWLNERCR